VSSSSSAETLQGGIPDRHDGFRKLQIKQNGRFIFLLVASAAAVAINVPSLLEEKVEGDSQMRPFSFQLDVDFIDKLARKPYLNLRRVVDDDMGYRMRPQGVPPSLRLLTVDLPEVVQLGVKGGDGCHLAADRVYPDGIAPSKRVSTDGSSKSGHKGNIRNVLSVEQKAWVTALFECSTASSQGSVSGIQVLQASTAALNPNGLRHNLQVGSYQYDPGKYFARNPKTAKGKDHQPDDSATTGQNHQPTKEQLLRETSHESPLWSEMDAPWHQYAWLEELQLRISGQVRFGESLEPASWWNRTVRGHVFKRTVQRSWYLLDLVGLPVWRGSSDRLELEAHGTVASQKPHAVIADGAALQRVPHALRWLQKTCRDEGVPLFVVRDPRRWGANTKFKIDLAVDVANGTDKNDLGPVLKQVRRVVKDRIVQASLPAGTGFERGRMVGRMETNARWEAKELIRKSKEAFQPPPDWRKLDERQLEMKLKERGIIDIDVDDTSKKRYSDALLALSKKCMQSSGARLADPTKSKEDVDSEHSSASTHEQDADHMSHS
jgi:hypothetical protein